MKQRLDHTKNLHRTAAQKTHHHHPNHHQQQQQRQKQQYREGRKSHAEPNVHTDISGHQIKDQPRCVVTENQRETTTHKDCAARH